MHDIPKAAQDDPLYVAFRKAAQQQRPLTGPELDVVEHAVRVTVRFLKARGTLPEHVIVYVRRAAMDCGVDVMHGVLFERLIRWCVNEYFSQELA